MKISDQQALMLFIILKDGLLIRGGFTYNDKQRFNLFKELIEQQDRKIKELGEDLHYCAGEEFQKLQKELSRKQDALCPFCHQDDCEHWDGTGWIKPKEKEEKE